MAGFLFQDIVFGPVKSRRFGVSLGVNLLPLHSKICSYNCIYCECGLTPDCNQPGGEFFSRQDIRQAMLQKFQSLKEKGIDPDNITFAGNGEPTMHPEFPEIIDDTLELRNRFFPQTLITVLSNASTLRHKATKAALLKVDNNVLKLDAGTEKYLRLINDPGENIRLAEIVEELKSFGGQLIIQSLFLKGKINGKPFDSSDPENLDPWLDHIKAINPRLVMIYPIDRATPLEGLEKLSPVELDRVATRVNELGIKTDVYY
jgi:wyosine [tRNA(Phe)-imidazoG37] synthetase (radical SAM superfamily)